MKAPIGKQFIAVTKVRSIGRLLHFFRELIEEYPTAKFVLTHRNPESWADSFGGTIYQLLPGRDQAPPERKD